MNLLQKLLEIQGSVDAFVKDGQNKDGGNYKYVSSDMVLDTVRPKMQELGLLLEPTVTGHALHAGETKSGTVRYMTEMDITFTWIDVETGESRSVPFYAQGVDLAGEKGVGKALTYGEKYFLMKYFHVPTSKDDPDSDGRTRTGEKRQIGTQAAKENALYYKRAIMQMLEEAYSGDAQKVKDSLMYYTKNDSRKYAGTDDIEKVSDMSLPVIYAKVKAAYKIRTGADFVYKPPEEDGV